MLRLRRVASPDPGTPFGTTIVKKIATKHLATTRWESGAGRFAGHFYELRRLVQVGAKPEGSAVRLTPSSLADRPGERTGLCATATRQTQGPSIAQDKYSVFHYLHIL